MTPDMPLSWTCPSCGREEPGTRFCSACGERRLTDRDRTLAGLLGQWSESLLHVDGRILRTCLTLVRAPGALTVAYVAGRRKPFVAPFQLFIAINVAFFIVQSLSRLAILSTPLNVHLTGMSYRALAQLMVNAHLAKHGTTLAVYAPVFDAREGAIAKSLVILMVLALAAVGGLVFYRRRLPVPTHVVFALHFYAFMLLFLTFFFPVLALTLLALVGAGVHITAPVVDNIATAIEVAAIGGYLFVSLPKVYGGGHWARLSGTVVLTAAVGLVFYAYRFVVFWLTLLTT